MAADKKERKSQKKKKNKILENKERNTFINQSQIHRTEKEVIYQDLNQDYQKHERLVQKFDRIYDFLPVGYVNLTKEGKILRCNLAFSSMIGIDRSFLNKSSLFDFVLRKDWDLLSDHLDKLIENHGKAKCQLKLKNMKDNVVHVQMESSFDQDEQDRMITMTSIMEITDRVRIHNSLKKSEEMFRTLAENAPDIIARFDRNLRHIYVNEKTTEVLGIPKKEILGKTNRDLGYPENLVGLWSEKISKVFRKKKKFIMEYQVEVVEGRRYFETSLVPEFDEKGEVISVLGITRDVTHFKEHEQKIIALNKQLDQKYRDLNLVNKELKSFTYSVSHDLRAPLRSIKGFTEALKEDFSEDWPDEAKDYLRRILRASNRMTHLIDSLLELSRLSRKKLETELIDLGQIARKFSSELQTSHPERNVEFVIGDGLEVWGDPQLMNAALRNLIWNAWKFTKPCSKPRIELGVSNQKREKIYFVRDNGVGFDMSYSHKLFIPFQRLHSSSDFPGAGIGLSSVQRIIHRHNGRIWAEAEEGKGATFYFTVKEKGESK